MTQIARTGRNIFILLFSFSMAAVSVSAADGESSAITVSDYRAPVSLADSKTVLIFKGDSPSYKDSAFDDSSWSCISLPHRWTSIYRGWTGICWYRIHVRFPSSLPDRSIAVSLGMIDDADEVYFNGSLIGCSGRIDPPAESSYDKERVYEIPVSAIRPGQDNVLAVRVRGLFSDAGGIHTKNIAIGPMIPMLHDVILRDAANLVFVIVYLVFVFSFAWYFFKRRDHSDMYFCLCCLSMAVYFALRTQIKHYLGFDFYYAKKAEYMILSISVVCWLEFVRSYFRQKVNFIFAVYYILSAVSVSSLALTRDFQSWRNINHYINHPLWVLCAFLIFYVVIRNVLRKKTDAYFMLAGFIFLLISMIHDSMVDRTVSGFTQLTNYGFFAVVVSFAAIINRRHISLYHQLEDLTANLESKVSARTEELNQLNGRLQESNSSISELNVRYLGDFRLAAKVQMGLVPPPLSSEYWSSASVFRPSSLVSGDFYDIYTLDRDMIGAVIADASGHGVGSALVTMIAKPVFMRRMKDEREADLGEVLSSVNNELNSEIGDIDSFLSAVIVRLEKNRITVSNAGHPPALLRNTDGSVTAFDASGSYLGIPQFSMPYGSESADIYPGSVLLCFSDALVEARNAAGEEFGLSRVIQILSEKDRTPEELVNILTNKLFSFTGNSGLDDDLTIVVFRRGDSCV